jgi:hypothetical protein
MNWYRQAKLLDVDPTEKRKTYVRCSTCNKFKTFEDGENEEDVVWKSFEEMNEEERKNLEIAYRMCKEIGYRAPVGITDAYCQECFDAKMKEIDAFIEERRKEKSVQEAVEAVEAVESV